MKRTDVFGFLLLAVGVAGVILGLGAVARDIHSGWAGIALGIGLNLVAYRMMNEKIDVVPERADGATRRVERSGSAPVEGARGPSDEQPEANA